MANYILAYCNHQQNDSLLRQIILLIGYYAVLNQDNQVCYSREFIRDRFVVVFFSVVLPLVIDRPFYNNYHVYHFVIFLNQNI